jgi:hypothetical protein
MMQILRDLVERDLLVQHQGRWRIPPADALDLPPDAAEAVQRRLARLDPRTRALAGIAAVLGSRPTRAALLALGGLDEAACFDALDALAAAQLVLPEAEALRFGHDRIREACYAAIPPDVRQALHLRCAAYMEAQGAEPAELGGHFEAAGEPARAWPHLAAAAERLDAAGVPLGAFAYRLRAERCLAALPDPDPVALARLRWQAGLAGFNALPLQAIPPLERLAAAPVPAGPGLPPAVDVGLILTSAYGFAGLPRRAREAAARAGRLIADPADPLHATLLAVQCAGWLAAGHVDMMAAASRRAHELTGRVDLAQASPLVRRASMAMRGYANARAYQGYPPDAAAEAAAEAMADELGAAATAGVIRHYRGVWLGWSGRAEALEAFLDDEERRARALGGAPHATVPYLRAYLALLRGDRAAGLALAERARRQGAAVGPVETYLAALEARLAPEVDLAPLAEAIARAEEAGLDLPAAHGRLAIAATELARWTGGAVVPAGVEASLATGAAGPARALAAAEAALAQVVPRAAARNPLHQAQALRLAGEAHLALGDPARAAERLAEALAVATGPDLDVPLELGEIHRARGELAIATDHRDAARDALALAAGCFRQLGSLPGLHAVQRALGRLEPTTSAPADEWDELAALLEGL